MAPHMLLLLALSPSYSELMQTEMHHVRTLKIMSDVYSRGMMQELQFEQQTVEKVFPCLDDLLNIHNQFFQRILERKKESLADKSEKNFVIKRIGDILVNQVSDEKHLRVLSMEPEVGYSQVPDSSFPLTSSDPGHVTSPLCTSVFPPSLCLIYLLRI